MLHQNFIKIHPSYWSFAKLYLQVIKNLLVIPSFMHKFRFVYQGLTALYINCTAQINFTKKITTDQIYLINCPPGIEEICGCY